MPKPKKPTAKPPARRMTAPSKPPVLKRIEPQRISRPSLDRNTVLFWGAVVVVGAQLFAPAHLKPFKLAGDAAAQFHGALFDEVNRKELELAQQQAIAQKMADLQADYANWKGLCSLTGAFDPMLGAACMQGADEHFQNALRQIRRSELIYR